MNDCINSEKGKDGCEWWLEHLDGEEVSPEEEMKWRRHREGCEDCQRGMKMWQEEIEVSLRKPLPGAGAGLMERVMSLTGEAGRLVPVEKEQEVVVDRVSWFKRVPLREVAALAILAGAAFTMLNPERFDGEGGRDLARSGGGPLQSEVELVHADVMAGARAVGGPMKAFFSAVSP